MTVSVIERLSSSFTDTTLPVSYRDPILNAGSLFLFDFSNPYCWNPANTVADGAAVTNLLDGAPGGNIRMPNAGMTFVSGKGFQLPSTATLDRVEIDSGTNYFQTNLTHDFLINAWVKYPATDPGSGNIGLIFNKGGSTNNYGQPGPYMAARFPAESGPSTSYGDITAKMDAASSVAGAVNNTSVGAVPGSHLYSLAKVGPNIQIWKDGVMLLSAATLTPALTANSNTMNFGSSTIQSAVQGIILNRIGAEDLTISGNTAAAQIAAEYAWKSGSFT